MGGDSLSAMRLVAAVNEALGAGLSVRAVFEAPTVGQLAVVSGVRVPPGWRRCGRWRARRWCRCRLPSSGCGF
ncbi:phosphopantetheine attachment site family protein [Mycobacterium xenopi 4042]|uniref:Phosphopantetheine attachment site family protein n=1 Tax=Mycobacterium xenopi 4042 TaxID=1299334 RepID=X7YLW8_MYCXE|nr:phosphopantetheine attachment site family protein [Mycobacterium xenopi 4042]